MDIAGQILVLLAIIEHKKEIQAPVIVIGKTVFTIERNCGTTQLGASSRNRGKFPCISGVSRYFPKLKTYLGMKLFSPSIR